MLLKEFRISFNKSQADVAKAINITRAAYSNYENGIRMPGIDTLVLLAQYYGVSVDALLGITVEREQLNQLEKELIEIFRPLSEENKYQVLGMIRLLAYQQDQNVQIEEEGNVG